MRSRRGSLLLAFTCGAALLAGPATGVWQNKDFKDWTLRDAQAVMADSPWAKRVPMPAFGRPGVMVIEPGSNGAPAPSASVGNPSNTTTGTNMTVAGNAGSAGPADPNGLHTMSNTQSPSQVNGPAGAPVPQPGLTIIWASATPVRLAVLKLRSDGNQPTDAQIQAANTPRSNYVIAVAGLPAPEPDLDPKDLARQAFLTIHGRAPLAANESSYRKIGNSDVYFFHFTRATSPISLNDGQVEFRMKMGQMELKRKFDLKEMQYQGQLAL